MNNSTTMTMGTNSLKFGGRIRGVSQADRSTSNYNGTFTFTSMDRYRSTLLLAQQGVPASQFHVAEDYHQEYFQRVGAGNPYCSYVIEPKVSKFRKHFVERLKR